MAENVSISGIRGKNVAIKVISSKEVAFGMIALVLASVVGALSERSVAPQMAVASFVVVWILERWRERRRKVHPAEIAVAGTAAAVPTCSCLRTDGVLREGGLVRTIVRCSLASLGALSGSALAAPTENETQKGGGAQMTMKVRESPPQGGGQPPLKATTTSSQDSRNGKSNENEGGGAVIASDSPEECSTFEAESPLRRDAGVLIVHESGGVTELGRRVISEIYEHPDEAGTSPLIVLFSDKQNCYQARDASCTVDSRPGLQHVSTAGLSSFRELLSTPEVARMRAKTPFMHVLFFFSKEAYFANIDQEILRYLTVSTISEDIPGDPFYHEPALAPYKHLAAITGGQLAFAPGRGENAAESEFTSRVLEAVSVLLNWKFNVWWKVPLSDDGDLSVQVLIDGQKNETYQVSNPNKCSRQARFEWYRDDLFEFVALPCPGLREPLREKSGTVIVRVDKCSLAGAVE